MILIRLLFFTCCLSLLQLNLYCFNPKDIFSKLLQKNETQFISKEYSIKPHTTFILSVGTGSVTIKSWSQPKVLIEGTKQGTREQLQNTSIYIKQQDKTLTVETRFKESDKQTQAAQIDYTLLVPEDSAISLKNTGTSAVKIKQITGAIDIALTHGTIEIYDSTNTVIAKTNKGNIKVKQKTFSQTGSIFLETFKGTISLSLPRATNANIQARTQNGSIETKQPLALNTRVMALNTNTWQQFKRDIEGKLGLGGAPITLETTYGTITLDE